MENVLPAITFVAGVGTVFHMVKYKPVDDGTAGFDGGIFGQYWRSSPNINLGLNKINHPGRNIVNYHLNGLKLPEHVSDTYTRLRLDNTAFSTTRKDAYNVKDHRKGQPTRLGMARNRGISVTKPRQGKHHTGQTVNTPYWNPMNHVPPTLKHSVMSELIDK